MTTYAVLVVTGLALLAGNWSTVNPHRLFGDEVLGWLITAGYGGVGVLVVLRLPHHRVGLLFLAVGWLLAAQQVLQELAARLLVVHPAAHALGAAAALVSGLLGPLWIIVLTALVLVFPERPLDRPGRRLLWLSAGAATIGWVVGGLTRGEVRGARDIRLSADNPLGVIPQRVGGWSYVIGLMSVLMLLVAGVRLVRRFHRSVGVERAQLAWPAYVAALSLAALLLSALPVPVITDFHQLAGLGVAVGIPGGCLIAISRYRLFAIDRLVSRTVLYGALTGLLLALYAGLVTALGRVVPVDSDVGVATATLTVAALVQPLRRRLQRVVDRRFNRTRYDADRTVDEFAQRLRGQVKLEAVCDDLLLVVDAAVQPASSRLWLRNSVTRGGFG